MINCRAVSQTVYGSLMANSIPFDSWNIDDAGRYLTRVVGLKDDLAIYELNEKFGQGRLRWRRTDPPRAAAVSRPSSILVAQKVPRPRRCDVAGVLWHEG